MGFNNEVLEALNDGHRLRHHERNEGLDTSIIYIPVKRLAQMSGKTVPSVHYDISRGKLVAARRGKGACATLIHPEEAKRYILAQGEKEKCSAA